MSFWAGQGGGAGGGNNTGESSQPTSTVTQTLENGATIQIPVTTVDQSAALAAAQQSQTNANNYAQYGAAMYGTAYGTQSLQLGGIGGGVTSTAPPTPGPGPSGTATLNPLTTEEILILLGGLAIVIFVIWALGTRG